MKKDGFDTWLQDSLQDHDSPIPVGGWQALHQAKKKKKRVGFLWPFAAVIFLLAGAGFGYYMRQESRMEPGALSEKEPVESFEQPKHSLANRADNTEYSNLDKQTIAKPREQVPSSVSTLKTPSYSNSSYTNSSYTNPSHSNSSYTESLLGPDSASVRTGSETIPVGTIRIVKLGFMIDALALKPFQGNMMDFTTDRRIGGAWFRGFYMQALASGGEMHFKSKNGEIAEPNYGLIINKSKLNERRLSFGLGAEFSLNGHFTLLGGIQFEQSQVQGTFDYTKYDYDYDPFGNANPSWVGNQGLQANNYRYDIKVATQQLSVPILLRYKLRYGSGPLAEIGAKYSYTIKSSGDWINPEDLQPMTINNQFTPRHHISPQFGLGYMLRMKHSQIALIYQFSPWSASHTPPSGRMGSNGHGLKLQWQMPY